MCERAPGKSDRALARGNDRRADKRDHRARACGGTLVMERLLLLTLGD